MTITEVPRTTATTVDVVSFDAVGLEDLAAVGGKNASLGELIRSLSAAGVRVPDGFATTADAFRRHLATSGLEHWIARQLEGLDVEDTRALARVGRAVRERIATTDLGIAFELSVRAAFERLTSGMPDGVSFAVRSSATAEDLPDSSFAGQQETFLNVRGVESVLEAIRQVFASLYTDRAIAYRVHRGFVHDEVAISVGVQRMVRSDLAASGVMFTLDTETGFDRAVFVTSAFGLGEGVVQGAVNPDEFTVSKTALAAGRPAVLSRLVGAKATRMVFTEDTAVGRTTAFVDTDPLDRRRFSLTDAEVTELARTAVAIERHYGRPMDIEWGKDGLDGQLYVLQARPETVASRSLAGVVERHRLAATPTESPLLEGRAIGARIGAGPVRVLASPHEMHDFEEGEVLVADMTDPDWEPVMKRASAIVTNRGGRTCHAAIIARELGIPAVVGTGSATTVLADGDAVTVSCAEGETGRVFAGLLDVVTERVEVDDLPDLGVDLMLNVGSPEQAFGFQALPNAGVGLARMEFVVNRQIGVHPKALLHLADQPTELREQIEDRIAAYGSPRDYFVRRLAEGISTLAAAFDPKPVIVRLSDFKSNEYAHLLGGAAYEPDEENPMIGFRGAARYLSDDFAEAFALECEAIRTVRDVMGFTNVRVMIPFVRTVEEASGVVERMASNGLVRGRDGLQVVMMCEIPSNTLDADRFLDHVDGFSIGSNDLTQLTLGVDRDSGIVAESFDERNPAVLRLIDMAIDACRARGAYVGICGQGPSDHPDLAEHLMARGISSMSLNPDSVVDTWQRLATGVERRHG